jgi:hypothetical protein
MKDGSIAAFWITPKGSARCTVSMQQARLTDRAAAERAKKYWGERLQALAKAVG